MKKRIISLAIALLLVCGMPVSAFAEEYDLATGSITVTANEGGQSVTQVNGVSDHQETTPTVITQHDSSTPTTNTVTINAAENATANVTIQDVNIVISDPAGSTQNHSGDAAVTIDVAEKAEANVTLDGVNIDVSGTGNIRKNAPGEAAVQITGNGDVTLELDGTNTVQSGSGRAGVEKNTIAATETDPGNGNGNLTITDENGTAGSLEATGGLDGSGIGGGHDRSGSNITITGNAEVTAQGGQSGAGIGGGAYRDGSNINISGSAEVTANGGKYGAGIGGGQRGNGSEITISGGTVEANGGENDGAGIGGGAYGSGNNIKISGTAEVTAKGGSYGAGIGGGFRSSGSNITISQDAQVKAQGGESGKSNGSTEVFYGAGAAIGNGGKSGYLDSPKLNGAEATPNTDELTANGKIEYYAPGADMKAADPIKTVTGTYVPPQDEEKPDQPSQSAEAVYSAPLYRVVNQDGKDILHSDARQDGVLTITVDADIASLTGKLGGIQTLKAQGIDTIVFVTNGATSTFALSDLLAQGSTGDSYTLNHNGDTVSFTLGEAKTDINEILAQP